MRSSESTHKEPNRKVAIVTGANSGIGFETSKVLAEKDFHVILACRDINAAERARNEIVGAVPAANLSVMRLDLSDLDCVKQFAAYVTAHFTGLHLLINNAGIMMSPYKVTPDGFENQFATNFLGHFALTGLLLPMLASTMHARVVSLSSLSYKWAPINFDDLQLERGYDKRKAYGQSKRACLVFAYELQRRLAASGLTTLSVAAHPGLSKTNLDRYFPALIRPLGALFLQSPKMGALPVLYAALNEGLRGGEYIGPDGFQEMRGQPTIVDSDSDSKSAVIGRRLWQVAEALTGVRYALTLI